MHPHSTPLHPCAATTPPRKAPPFSKGGLGGLPPRHKPPTPLRLRDPGGYGSRSSCDKLRMNGGLGRPSRRQPPTPSAAAASARPATSSGRTDATILQTPDAGPAVIPAPAGIRTPAALAGAGLVVVAWVGSAGRFSLTQPAPAGRGPAPGGFYGVAWWLYGVGGWRRGGESPQPPFCERGAFRILLHCHSRRHFLSLSRHSCPYPVIPVPIPSFPPIPPFPPPPSFPRKRESTP